VYQSVSGLMDAALPASEQAALKKVLEPYIQSGIQCHAVRTRQSGMRRFVSLHVLVPGSWTVHHGHSLLEEIESAIRLALPNVTVLTHLESIEDPCSWKDTDLDRIEQELADIPQVSTEKKAEDKIKSKNNM
jgi:divalent metal cation (Fe/Co/Zn/Cd) transporter